MAFENETSNQFSRAGSMLSVKAAGMAVFLAKGVFVVAKILFLKILVVLGFKAVLIAGSALLSGMLLSGLLQGVSGKEGQYREASVAAIPEVERGYLKQYAAPWRLLEAFDIALGNGQFGGYDTAEALSPAVSRDANGRISLVSAWNGFYYYTYHTHRTILEDGTIETRTEVRIGFREDWGKMDSAIRQKTGAALSIDDRDMLLGMSKIQE